MRASRLFPAITGACSKLHTINFSRFEKVIKILTALRGTLWWPPCPHFGLRNYWNTDPISIAHFVQNAALKCGLLAFNPSADAKTSERTNALSVRLLSKKSQKPIRPFGGLFISGVGIGQVFLVEFQLLNKPLDLLDAHRTTHGQSEPLAKAMLPGSVIFRPPS